MGVDNYTGGAEAWAAGAALVYRPLASELAARAPHPLDGRVVLDVGAGTGVGSVALTDVGARPVSTDLSHDMLAWQRRARPPSVVGDVLSLPVRNCGVNDTFASFVLNHLTQPVVAIHELARVTQHGGAMLATVYATASRSTVRDRIDEVAGEHGWVVPDWYVAMKRDAVPLLGSAEAMAATARAAGLHDVVTDEVPVDVGVHRAADLVDYRFGQAQLSGWVASLPPARRAEVRGAAIAAVEPIMVPYSPTVVFLSAVVGAKNSER